jgi:hypothetical protein
MVKPGLISSLIQGVTRQNTQSINHCALAFGYDSLERSASMSNADTAPRGPRAFGTRAESAAFAIDDVVDAEFVTLDPGERSDRSADEIFLRPTAADAADMPQLDGMDMLRRHANRALPAANPNRASPSFWVAGVIVAAAAFWIAGGHAVVRPAIAAMDSAPPESGLRIASVVSQVDRSGNRPVLLIDGQAVNDGVETAAVPPLDIQVISPAGGLTRYKLGTAGRPLDSGQTFAFSSRLDLPKDGVKTVFVTFAD